MKRIAVVHWNAEEGKELGGLLKDAGYDAELAVPEGNSFLRKLAASPPDAVVIGLSRLPMQGRDIALGIRQVKATRRVPILFVDGEKEKVQRVHASLPDAEFTVSRRIRSALKKAISHPPENPIVPSSILAGYSGTP